MNKFVNILAYVGSASLLSAPWVGEMMIPAIITGMLLMTPQAVKLGAWNLVILNLVGMVGYIWRLGA